MTEHIAFYGKGGVGTSTLVSNISAALGEAGGRVMQVGYGPRGDSGLTLGAGHTAPSVLDLLQSGGDPARAVSYGFKGIASLEIGRPAPGSHIQQEQQLGRALGLIETGLTDELKPDFVFYDISGDENLRAYRQSVAHPGRRRLFIVTTADFMSLSAANAIIASLQQENGTQPVIPFGGLIPNSIGSSFEDTFVGDFARRSSSHLLGRIPRSLMVRQCELYGRTVIEASPLSNQAYFYRRLANQIVDESRTLTVKSRPTAFSGENLRSWAREWADRLYAIENGLVSDGASI